MMMRLSTLCLIFILAAFEAPAQNSITFILEDTASGIRARNNDCLFNTTGELRNCFLLADTALFNGIVLAFDSSGYNIPDRLFEFSQIRYMQIIAPTVSLDSRFGKLSKLFVLEVICDTLLNLSDSIAMLPELERLNISVEKYYPPSLKKRVPEIIRNSRSKYLAIALGHYQCRRKENGRSIKCVK